MIDPKEKNKDTQEENKEKLQDKTPDNSDSNWDEHQQIDEEGNEITPDDIK